MYIDETIVASLVVVLGTIGFLGGFGYLVYKDLKESKEN